MYNCTGYGAKRLLKEFTTKECIRRLLWIISQTLWLHGSPAARAQGREQFVTLQQDTVWTSGYATMVHGRGCNPHRCTTTFANVEITSWWRHNSETIRDRQKRRPHCHMKSSELSNGENRIALRQLLQNRKLCQWWRHNLGSRWKLQKMAQENFNIRALYNITKNQHDLIKTVGRDSFLSPKPLKIQVFWGHPAPRGRTAPIF